MKLIKAAFDMILPPKCSVCGNVLKSNEDSIFGVSSTICFRCLRQIVPVSSVNRWLICLSEPYSGDPIPDLVLFMPFVYTGFFSRAIPIVKFARCKELAVLLGAILGEIVKTEGIAADLIVPVPLSKERLSERGFNQAEIISQKVSESIKIPLVSDCLFRGRNTLRQTEITDINLRISNVSGAFFVNENWSVDGLTIILIDDVVTTGFTIHEAALALIESGAERVICIALAGNRLIKNADAY